MHTHFSVHASICVCVCQLQCVNTSSVLRTNPRSRQDHPPSPSLVSPSYTHTHTPHTHTPQYTRFHLGLGFPRHRHIGYISPHGFEASLGASMSTGMVVGATGQVSFDGGSDFHWDNDSELGLLCCSHER